MPLDLPGRIETLRAHPGRVAAVYPVRAPRGLLRAFGYLPVEVWGPPRADSARASGSVQAYVCSVVRCGLGYLEAGGLDLADLIVVPHACDALQGLGSLLLDLRPPRQPVLPLYLPRGDRARAVEFLTAELRGFRERLAGLTGGDVGDEALLAAIEREEEADLALGRLLAARRRVALSNLDFYRLVRAREYLPAEVFVDRVGPVLAAGGEPPEARGVPVVISGIVPEPMSLLEVLSDAGALVVADDLAACGRRLLPPGTSTDPARREAERLLGGPPCSTLSSPVEARARHLLDLCREHGARAVLFQVPRSCEPEQFYRPLLQRAVREAGLRELSLEVEIDEPLAQQAVTRVEALVETA